MSNGTSVISSRLLKDNAWQRLFLKQGKGDEPSLRNAVYMLGSGVTLGECFEARLVKVWETRDSQGQQAFNWADRCSSVNMVTPARWIRSPGAKTCGECSRRKRFKDIPNPCYEIFTLGVLLKEPETYAVFDGKKNAKKAVNKLLQALTLHGELDLLTTEVWLKFGSELKKNGGLVYDEVQTAYTLVPNQLLDDESREKIVTYELEQTEEEEQDETPF